MYFFKNVLTGITEHLFYELHFHVNMRINWMVVNAVKVPSIPTTIFFCFNIWLMNTEKLFKRRGRPNNYNDIYNQYTLLEKLQLSHAWQLVTWLYFSLLGIGKREGGMLYIYIYIYIYNKERKSFHNNRRVMYRKSFFFTKFATW